MNFEHHGVTLYVKDDPLTPPEDFKKYVDGLKATYDELVKTVPDHLFAMLHLMSVQICVHMRHPKEPFKPSMVLDEMAKLIVTVMMSQPDPLAASVAFIELLTKNVGQHVAIQRDQVRAEVMQALSKGLAGMVRVEMPAPQHSHTVDPPFPPEGNKNAH